MPQSLASVLVHIIFSTKNRLPLLKAPELRSQVHSYLTATLRELNCEPLQVGGVEDHVHLLSTLSRTIAVSELIKNLKTSSTRIVKDKGHRDFGWQSGYGAFSVSPSTKESVIAYITDQEAHHRKVTFQDEFRAFLGKHGIKFDERYVWD
jgi:putative transposase